MCARDLGLVHACTLIGGSVSVTPHRTSLVYCVGHFVVFLVPMSLSALPLTVKSFHSLASVPCPSTKSKRVSTTPNLQHMKMGSVQCPSPKYRGAGGVVPEDQQRVNARRKEDRRIWLEL